MSVKSIVSLLIFCWDDVFVDECEILNFFPVIVFCLFLYFKPAIRGQKRYQGLFIWFYWHFFAGLFVLIDSFRWSWGKEVRLTLGSPAGACLGQPHVDHTTFPEMSNTSSLQFPPLLTGLPHTLPPWPFLGRKDQWPGLWHQQQRVQNHMVSLAQF